MVGCRKQLKHLPADRVWYLQEEPIVEYFVAETLSCWGDSFTLTRYCGNEGYPTKNGIWHNYCEDCMRRGGYIW